MEKSEYDRLYMLTFGADEKTITLLTRFGDPYLRLKGEGFREGEN